MNVRECIRNNSGLFHGVELYWFTDERMRILGGCVEFICGRYYHEKVREYLELHDEYGPFSDYLEYPLAEDDSYRLMNETVYNSVMCHGYSGISFEEWYGTRDAKVLVIIVTTDNYEQYIERRCLN